MSKLFASILTVCTIAVFAAQGCTGASANPGGFDDKTNTEQMDTKEIYLAGGCFWGTEHFMKMLPGVTDTETGYANSNVPNPTYRQVCTGTTGAAETVKVVYDPKTISLPFLLDMYYQTIDPTSLNRQGNDRGTQYRTGVYYTDPADRSVVLTSLEKLKKAFDSKVVVEVGELRNFYPAEDYHQDYLENNPGGYCHINPDLFRLARMARDTTSATSSPR